jgi:predicted HAD superfamily hydrolase
MRAVGPPLPVAAGAEHRLAPFLSRFDALSLDVFDTAVLRRVARPVDVFDWVARDFAVRHPGAEALDWKTLRIDAETRARARARVHGRGEVTLDDIYDAVYELSAEQRAELRALEIAAELRLCVAHPTVARLYREARRRGLPVVFVSDMYLPQEVVEEILRACGYDDHAGLFLSSSLGITKADGDLFAKVAGTLGVEPHRILHVGDDRESDVSVARRQGFVAVHEPRPPKVASPDPWSSVHRALQRERRLSVDDDFWSRIGYERAGLLYLGFVSWVREQALRRGCDRIWFLARDGFVLREVHQRLTRRLGDGPPASYVYASRRALNLPAMTSLGEAELDFLTGGYTPLRVCDFLARVGLDAREHERQIAAAGLRADERTGSQERGRVRALFRSLEPELLAGARAEREVAIDYLREQGLFSSRKIAVVDLGWHGTLQRSLARLAAEAGAPTTFAGLYLGTFARARQVAQGLELDGYLCSFGAPARFDDAIQACCEIWEFLHAAPHGSVIRWHRTPRGIEPVLAPDDASVEERAAVEALQRAALDYIDDALEVLGDRAVSIAPETAAGPVEELVLHPTREQAVRFGDLRHGEGFGGVVELRALVPPPSWKARAGAPRVLRQEFDHAYWKQGYLGRNPLARWARLKRR